MKQEIVRIINSKCVGIKCEECNYKGKVLCESYYIADKIMNLFNDKEKVIQNEQIQNDFIYLKSENHTPKFFNIKQITIIEQMLNGIWRVGFADNCSIKLTPDLAKSLFEILGIEEK